MALVELAELLNDEQRRGAAPLPDPMPSTSPAAAYGGLVAALPPSARLAAAAAAAAGNVTPAVLADALARLGSDYVQLATVESSGLLRITRAAVLWRHPLARARPCRPLVPPSAAGFRRPSPTPCRTRAATWRQWCGTGSLAPPDPTRGWRPRWR